MRWRSRRQKKAIKALLVAADVDPPRTHNLLRLARILAEGRARLLLELDLEELARWATEGRYPEDLDAACTDDATRAAELAGQVTALFGGVRSAAVPLSDR